MDKHLEFRWLGVAGFELSAPGMTLLVDPFLTRPPFYKLLFGRTRPDAALLRQHLPRADAILVSHAHYDHLLDVAEIASYTGARVYGSANTSRLVEVCGVDPGQVVRVRAGEALALTRDPSPCKGGADPHLRPFSVQGRGESTSLPPARGEMEGGTRESTFHITFLSGEHTPVPVFRPGRLPARLRYPLRLRDFVMDEDFSFLIQVGETRVLAWHHWRPGPAPQAEVLVIGADIRLPDLSELLDQVGPRLLIPTHWDNFLRRLSKPLKPFFRPPCPGHPLPERYDPWAVKRWVEQVRPGVRVWVPELLASLRFSRTAH